MVARYAGIELGGTKAIAVLAEGDRIIERQRIPTATPGETLPALSRYLRQWAQDAPLAGLGIASFGPLQLQEDASDFGNLLLTPKPGWRGANLLEALTDGLTCPVALDTDVNAAALAERLWGAGQGCDALCYLTIGTGVGGGVVIAGIPIHGAMHPEIGHLKLRRARGDSFAGVCPFHGDCIEGLISGPALAQRFGADPASIAEDDARWEAVAFDLAALAATILLTVSAERILVGGGVGLARPHTLQRAGQLLCEMLAGYLPFVDDQKVEAIFRPAGLGGDAGPAGAIALAQLAAGHNRGR